jgi:hypothetical protein
LSLPTRTNPTVAVIGGGIFGATCAIELSSSFTVTLFERDSGLLRGATYANHNRHHYGFHYPRSPDTIEQCLRSRGDFERAYGECVDWDFDNYYCVAGEGSKTTPADYLDVMGRFGLEFAAVPAPAAIIDPNKVALCLRVREGVYDVAKLRSMVERRLAGCASVEVLLLHEVRSGQTRQDGRKLLFVDGPEGTRERVFDFVVNVTYARTNRFREWFGFDKKKCQFNLQELDVLELPLDRRVGVTVQDGNFPSLLPIANSKRYLLAHVIESQLVREISFRGDPLMSRVSYVEGNWQGVREACQGHLPILRQATLVKSMFVDRVVDADCLETDTRLTELKNHGQGCWSIFAAKVLTCVTTGAELHRAMVAEARD